MVWSKVACTVAKGDSLPRPRGYHTSTLVDKNKILIYGGSDGNECFSDMHILDTDTHEWTRLKVSYRSPRLGHTATLVGSILLVFGGHDGCDYVNELSQLNLGTYTLSSG
jgi:hypothetical protein